MLKKGQNSIAPWVSTWASSTAPRRRLAPHGLPVRPCPGIMSSQGQHPARATAPSFARRDGCSVGASSAAIVRARKGVFFSFSFLFVNVFIGEIILQVQQCYMPRYHATTVVHTHTRARQIRLRAKRAPSSGFTAHLSESALSGGTAFRTNPSSKLSGCSMNGTRRPPSTCVMNTSPPRARARVSRNGERSATSAGTHHDQSHQGVQPVGGPAWQLCRRGAKSTRQHAQASTSSTHRVLSARHFKSAELAWQ
eukprot:scaffold13786_cov111-Isochrysis_galbana.AAC.2